MNETERRKAKAAWSRLIAKLEREKKEDEFDELIARYRVIQPAVIAPEWGTA